MWENSEQKSGDQTPFGHHSGTHSSHHPDASMRAHPAGHSNWPRGESAVGSGACAQSAASLMSHWADSNQPHHGMAPPMESVDSGGKEDSVIFAGSLASESGAPKSVATAMGGGKQADASVAMDTGSGDSGGDGGEESDESAAGGGETSDVPEHRAKEQHGEAKESHAPGPGPSGQTAKPTRVLPATQSKTAASPSGSGNAQAKTQALADLHKFRSHGLYGPQDITPSTGLGGFAASYNPRTESLHVTLQGGVQFKDGISVTNAATGQLKANHSGLNGMVANLYTLIPSAAQRVAFVQQNYHWAGASKKAFLRDFRQNVESAWNKSYRFQCTRPFWEALSARTKVKTSIHAGPKKAKEHVSIETYKMPQGVNVGAFVNSGASNNPYDQRMSIGSNAVKPRTDNLLRTTVLFTPGTAQLASPAVAAQIAATYQAANPASGGHAAPIVLHAHASEPGLKPADNRKLAHQRGAALFQAISAAAKATGTNFNMGRVTISVHPPEKNHAAAQQRVDVVVDGGGAQNVAAHETGHAFGLDDEYAINRGGSINGTGAPTGTATRHDGLAKAIGTAGSVNENDGSMMSLGNKVRPQHYATFGEALRVLTAVQEWKIHNR